MSRTADVMDLLNDAGVLTTSQVARRLTGGRFEVVEQHQIVVLLWWLHRKGWVARVGESGWCTARAAGWFA